MFTVVIGYLRNCQIRVMKLIRGSKVLKLYQSGMANMQLAVSRYISLLITHSAAVTDYTKVVYFIYVHVYIYIYNSE